VTAFRGNIVDHDQLRRPLGPRFFPVSDNGRAEHTPRDRARTNLSTLISFVRRGHDNARSSIQST
jgi:hypothetical protein